MATQATKKEYVVDGAKFSTLAEAASEFTRALRFTMSWTGNLDAFNDFLYGGFGTPEGGFVLVWRHSDLSQQSLGHPETVRWYEGHLTTCHPFNVPDMQQRLGEARQGRGPTLFDWLVDIIRHHRDIELRLE